MRFLDRAVLAVAVVSVATAGAQQPVAPGVPRSLIVRVLEEATHQPLPNAEVLLVRTGRRYLTNSQGEVRLSLAGSGPFSVCIRQIGFQPMTRELAAGSRDTTGATAIFRLSRVAYELPRVVATADFGCADFPEPASAELSARALEQLRASAERYEFFRREYPFDVEMRSVNSGLFVLPSRMMPVKRAPVSRSPFQCPACCVAVSCCC